MAEHIAEATGGDRHPVRIDGPRLLAERAALTGRTTSPGIFEVLTVLGKAESLARITDQARVTAA